MCGRYIINPDDRFFRDLAEIINKSPLTGRFKGKQPVTAGGAFGGEVTPASVVPVKSAAVRASDCIALYRPVSICTSLSVMAFVSMR